MNPVGLVFLLEYLDYIIKVQENVEKLLGISATCLIPYIGGKRGEEYAD